jgi:hypothetical protein
MAITKSPMLLASAVLEILAHALTLELERADTPRWQRA